MNQQPIKYSKEWFQIHGPEHGHANPFKAKNNDWPVRLSKSAFMTYLGCPRKYWWGNVAEIRGPRNHFMVHGTAVHTALENLYGNWVADTERGFGDLMMYDWEGDGDVYTPHLEWDGEQKRIYEGSVEALAQLEEERLRRWGAEHFAPEEFEVKHTFKVPDKNFVLVGMIDGVHRHPDGGLVITELKTGKVNSGKLSKTRKELCYYRYMLAMLGWDEAVYFYYLFPEATNTKLFHELDGKKNTEVWLGDLQGMAVLEKVQKRSITAMHKSLDKTFDGIEQSLWTIKWNDYFCTEWCDFNMSCEEQILGMSGDPTASYTADEEW